METEQADPLSFHRPQGRNPQGGNAMARILVIDDEAIIRTVTAMFLQHEGHEVIEASEGEEGLRLQREHEADLVITDLLMPNLDGFELIRHLRREYPKIGIIVVTGGGGEDYPLKASGLGADKVLEKPFTREELLKAVDDLLSK
jgi:DNA-binding response OmpR family regulator